MVTALTPGSPSRQRGAFELDPVNIIRAARTIAKYDCRPHDDKTASYQRTLQRIRDSINAGKLTAVDGNAIEHQAICRWAFDAFHDYPWFSELLKEPGFRVPPTSAAGRSTAGSTVIGQGFGWRDEHPWLRENYLKCKAECLRLQVEREAFIARINALEVEVSVMTAARDRRSAKAKEAQVESVKARKAQQRKKAR